MNALSRLPILLLVTALAAGCATTPERPSAALPEVSSFSGLRPGGTMPATWQPWSLSRFKPPSRYQLIEDAGATVVHAKAQASASGMIHYLDVDPRERPLLSWRWKVMDLFPSASSADDSPARIVVSFDGDLEKLDFSDRLFYDQFRLFTGQQLPYAALMYVWGSRTPTEGIVPNPYTSRVKIIVVESGRDRLGRWLSEQRNVAADFRRAFGEEPGKIISVGILTETDAGDRPLDVYYGDLGFYAPSDAIANSAQ
jgi:hypothetical protein